MNQAAFGSQGNYASSHDGSEKYNYAPSHAGELYETPKKQYANLVDEPVIASKQGPKKGVGKKSVAKPKYSDVQNVQPEKARSSQRLKQKGKNTKASGDKEVELTFEEI
jgi:hypothetical protein